MGLGVGGINWKTGNDIYTLLLLLLLLLLSHSSRVRLRATPETAPHQVPRPWNSPGTRTLEWATISFSSAWQWKVKVKLLSPVRLLATPRTAAYQAPPSRGFSRQEYWSGLPLPSPYTHYYIWNRSFSAGSGGRESTCNSGDSGSIPGSERSPAEENGNPFQYACFRNPMDRGYSPWRHKCLTWLVTKPPPHVWNRSIVRTCCIAQGTLLNTVPLLST